MSDLLNKVEFSETIESSVPTSSEQWVKSHNDSQIEEKGMIDWTLYSKAMMQKILKEHGLLKVFKDDTVETIREVLEEMELADPSGMEEKIARAIGLGTRGVPTKEKERQPDLVSQPRRHSTVKVKQPEEWTNGTLIELEDWIRVFANVVDECGYDDKQAKMRLEQYTVHSDDKNLILEYGKYYEWDEVLTKLVEFKVKALRGNRKKHLNDIKQGMESIQDYLNRFLDNKLEIERVWEKTYSQEDILEAFEEGLWRQLKVRLRLTNHVINTSNLFTFAECLVVLEAELHQERADRKPDKTLEAKEEIEDAQEQRKCKFWRKYGTCKFEKGCWNSTDHTNGTKGSWSSGGSVGSEGSGTGSNGGSNEKSAGGSGKLTFKVVVSKVLSAKAQEGTSPTFIDSGASFSATNVKEDFLYYEDTAVAKYTVGIGGIRVECPGWGVVGIKCNVTGNTMLLKMDYSPKMGDRLISQGQLDSAGAKWWGSNGKVKYSLDNEIMFVGNKSDKFANLYELDITYLKEAPEHAIKAAIEKYQKQVHVEQAAVFKAVKEEVISMHRMLGHANMKDLKTLGDYYPEMEILNATTRTDLDNYECETCMAVKPLRFKKKRSDGRSRKLVKSKVIMEDETEEVNFPVTGISVCTDLCGAFKPSYDGNKYLKVSIVKGLGMLYAKPMRSKLEDEAIADTREILDELEKYKKPARLYESDAAKELTGESTKDLMNVYGVEMSTGAGYDKNSNPFAERAIRTIVESTLCVLKDTHVPPILWDEAAAFSAFTKNIIMRTHMGKRCVPLEEMTGCKVDLPEHLYIFGSAGWAWKHTARDKSISGNMEKNVKAMYIGPGAIDGVKGAIWIDVEMLQAGRPRQECRFVSRKYKIHNGQSCNLHMGGYDHLFEEDDEDSDGDYEYDNSDSDVDPVTDDDPTDQGTGINRMKDTLSNQGSAPRRSGRVSTKGFYERALYSVEFKDAMKSMESEEWENAVQAERDAMVEFKVYDVITKAELEELKLQGPLAGGRVFNTRFVLDQKPEKKKARLVVQAFNFQKNGLEDVTSPVVKDDTFWLVINIGVNYDWKWIQMDAKNAFLQSSLDGKRCVVNSPEKNQLWILKKALYGHPMASLAWYSTMHKVMVGNDWERTIFDNCCYAKFDDYGKLIGLMIIHVDDFLATGYPECLADLKEILFKNFVMKVVEDGIYLGIKITVSEGCIHLDMERYIEKMAAKYLDDSNEEQFPYARSRITEVSAGEMNGNCLRTLMGSLIFVTKARPDVKYIVSFLCQFNEKYSEELVEMAKRVIRYLRTTKDLKMQVKKSDLELTGSFDAGYANEPDLKSRKGVLILMGGNYLHSSTKKETIMVDSSTYAEVRACQTGVKAVEYFKTVLKYLRLENNRPVKIYQDNKSAMKIMENGELSGRSKHFQISFLYVTEKIRRRIIELVFVRSESMKADGFTKALGRNKFGDFVKMLGLINARNNQGSAWFPPGSNVIEASTDESTIDDGAPGGRSNVADGKAAVARMVHGGQIFD